MNEWFYTNIDFFQYLFSFLLGCLFAIIEFLSRYKTSPVLIFKIPASYLYMLVNGLASWVTFYFLKESPVKISGFGGWEWGKVIIAGFASMAILRSSFFYFKIGDKNYDAGLAMIIQVFLNVADRAFDRKSSEYHLKQIEDIMDNVDFKKAESNLPMLCLNMMDNLSLQEFKEFGDEVALLSVKEINNFIKCVKLGKLISLYTGLPFLDHAVKSLKEKKIITISEPDTRLIDLIDKYRVKPVLKQ